MFLGKSVMGHSMRIVLDTNVFIAARFNPKSSSAKIIDLCIKKKYEPIFTSYLRKETELILENVKAGKKFRQKVRRLFKSALWVRPTRKISVIKEDPDDNKFLECAFKGRADYLITSDRHLLELGEFAGTKIRKPAHFLKLRSV
jgi:hypothetical protein